VIIPAHARLRHPKVLERMNSLKEHFNDPEWSRLEKGDPKCGVVTVGPVYTYVKEVLPEATILKLSSSFPLPEETLRKFCDSVDRVFVAEELEPVIELAMLAMGLEVEGKQLFPRTGEFSPEIVSRVLKKPGCWKLMKARMTGKFNPWCVLRCSVRDAPTPPATWHSGPWKHGWPEI